MVNDNKSPSDISVKKFIEYSTQMPENHSTVMTVPTAFNTTAFMKFDVCKESDTSNVEATVPWLTKGIYTPSYIYNAYTNTNFTEWNPYGASFDNSSLQSHLDDEYAKSDKFVNNAASKYTYGSLESSLDPTFAFGYGSKNKFISFAETNNYRYMDDLKRKLWIDTYVIPDASY